MSRSWSNRKLNPIVIYYALKKMFKMQIFLEDWNLGLEDLKSTQLPERL